MLMTKPPTKREMKTLREGAKHFEKVWRTRKQKAVEEFEQMDVTKASRKKFMRKATALVECHSQCCEELTSVCDLVIKRLMELPPKIATNYLWCEPYGADEGCFTDYLFVEVVALARQEAYEAVLRYVGADDAIVR